MSAKIQIKNNDYFVIIDGKIASQASFYRYSDMRDFDWINIVDVDTKEKFRRRGYAQILIQKMISDLDKKYHTMGQYLLVRTDNIPAIRLYQKFNFKEIRVVSDKLSGKRYSVMCRGNADKKQLMNVDFNLS